ncbi:MAG: alpha/beta fold hydrolase BchO [Beijerinckiaceae bacterium]
MNAPHASAHDRADWPNKAASCFVEAAGVHWHVQTAGQGPTLLLLHGAGASTHSWRDLFPILAETFRVVAPDLPGQGRSAPGPSSVYSIRGMARAISALLRRLGDRPDIVVGHSAGGAIAVRMTIDQLISPKVLVGINAALQPFGAGMASLYTGIARFLAINPLAPRMFAWRASWPGAVERLIEETGSKIDTQGVGFYRRLATDPKHVGATLRMMANWDLQELEANLPKLATPMHLILGARDRTLPPERAREAARYSTFIEVEESAGLGHLAHEEQPKVIAARIIAIARQHGLLPESAR